MTGHMKLRDPAEIVTQLGGPSAVGNLFGFSHSAVCHWVARGFFPAATFPVIRDRIAELGHQVDEDLWNWHREAS